MIFSSTLVVSAAQDTLPSGIGLVPIRSFFEDIGAEVFWHGDDNSIRIIVPEQWFMESDLHFTIFTDINVAAANRNEVSLLDGVHMRSGTAFISETDLTILLIAAFEDIVVRIHLTEQARDIALYDFDFLIDTIRENTPWDSVAYRRLGIDFEELVAANRRHIEEMTVLYLPAFEEFFPIKPGSDDRSLAANYLAYLLLYGFALPLDGVGHIGPIDLETYSIMAEGLKLAMYHSTDALSLNHLLLTQGVMLDPAAIWFYGEVDVDLYSDTHPLPILPHNVFTDIVIPGEVAYIDILTFMSNPDYDDAVIYSFLRETQGFDHLIIDLSFNAGGWMHYFDALLFYRLVSQPFETTDIQFFSSGALTHGIMQAYIEIFGTSDFDADWLESWSYELMTADDAIEEFGLTEFNQQDLERLHYALVFREAINPAFFPEEMRINFDGKIWLLVGPQTASAAAAAALTSMATDFATVVGENTSGVMAPLHVHVALPNTGIVWRMDVGYFTDADGRSLEVYGVTPDIHNLPGMSAFETVMTLITDRNY